MDQRLDLPALPFIMISSSQSSYIENELGAVSGYIARKHNEIVITLITLFIRASAYRHSFGTVGELYASTARLCHVRLDELVMRRLLAWCTM